MVRKVGFSIRYKILLLMTLLPLVVLAIYLSMAVKVFEDDKVAYVFESSSSVARTLAAQTTTDLESILTNSRPALQEFVTQGKFGVISKGCILVEGPLQWVNALRVGADGQFTALDLLLRDQVDQAGDWSKWPEASAFVSGVAQKGRLISVPFKDERVILGERVVIPANGTAPAETLVFVMLAKVPNIFQGFQSPGQAENFLVNTKGDILFGPPGSMGTQIQSQVALQFLADGGGKVRQGTEEVKRTSGEPLLASFSSTRFGDLFALSLVPKRAALKAVETLIRKSLIFFVILICVTVVVSLLASSGLTSALTDLFQATVKVAEGRFDIRVKVTGTDEVGSLATSFNAMAEEVSRLMLETAEKARMEGELKTAQTVQETLFPPPQATIRGLLVSGFYEPASECGGDWWHYCEINNKVYLWIGDATGHGAPAALITSAAKSAATVIEHLNVGPGQALSLLNRAVYEVSKGRIMMTFFLGCYDPESKKFTYSNASHEAPYLIKKSEKALTKKDLIPLNEVNSARLGQDTHSEFGEVSVDLDEGDRIFFYTDGIPDIQSPEKQAWGERDFIKGIVAVNREFPNVDVAMKNLIELFQTHRQGAGLIDDITCFMIQVGGVPS